MTATRKLEGQVHDGVITYDLAKEQPTLGDIEAALARHDVALSDVASIGIEAERRGDSTSPLVLVVRRYLHDAEGHRYVVKDPATGEREPARELVVIPLADLRF